MKRIEITGFKNMKFLEILPVIQKGWKFNLNDISGEYQSPNSASLDYDELYGFDR